jgi:metal-sulfur cluster biosynthetic enzyme
MTTSIAESTDYAPNPNIETLRNALRTVIDPEAGMNIVDLGLVYRLEASEATVSVDMTMTSPACPMGEMIVEEAETALRKVMPPAQELQVNLVWSPPWEPSLMSDDAKQHFGW